MNSKQIRQTFLDFFTQKQHQIVASSPMVVKNDPTLMFTNAGMNQFKDLFLGNSEIKFSRIADTQKCLRVSGKHNDLEEVGVDTYHHTMFEMLGNWSFGDPARNASHNDAGGYFKKDAIEWAWELLVDVYHIDKNKLYFTVFEGDEKDGTPWDEEAYNLWKNLLVKNGLSENKILKCNKKDNFWEMGDTGPCGPCSEIHVDIRSDEEIAKIPGRELVNNDHPQVIEIWNLVFMEFNRLASGELKKLPAQHVDTGMGFERLAMVLQGKKSNYDTDVFAPLIDKIVELTRIQYYHSLSAFHKTDVAIRVISDHVRAVSFSIADGQIPFKDGKGYVIRRILRRAIRYGYSSLNQNKPFIYKLVPVLTQQMGDFFPELKAQQELIAKVIKDEEESFLKTLIIGIDKLGVYRRNKLINSIYNYVQEKGFEISNNWVRSESKYNPDLFIPNLNLAIDIEDNYTQAGAHMRANKKGFNLIEGGDKFYHFPINLEEVERLNKIISQLSAIKSGQGLFNDFNYTLLVDGEFAFELYDTFGFPIDLTKLIIEELNGQVDVDGFEKELIKQKERSRAAGKIEASDWVILRDDDAEEFIGYDYTESDVYITKYRKVKTKGEEIFQLVFNLTPFYPEGGGQVGDTGYIESSDEKINIIDTKKENNLIIHFAEKLPATITTPFKAVVDSPTRMLTACNHSATHLMHHALREVLGKHVEQKGSLVNSDYLRFDFSHFEKVSDADLEKVEDLVNINILKNNKLQEYRAITIAEAEESGAMMLFGEKYGDVVRMIQFGDSKELCGGIHVNNTKEIELFKIKSEGAIAAGIRRIEALTSIGAGEWLKDKIETIERNDLTGLIPRDLSAKIYDIAKGFRNDYQLISGLPEIERHEATKGELVTASINNAINDFTKIKLSKHIIDALVEIKKQLAKEEGAEDKEQAKIIKQALLEKVEVINGINVIAQKINLSDSAAIKDLAFQLKSQVENLFLILGTEINGKPSLTIVISDNLVKEKGLHAGNIIRDAAKEMQGGGGGQPFYATAGGNNLAGLDAAIAKALSFLN